MNNIVKNLLMLAGGVIATGLGTWLTAKSTGAIQGEAFKASMPHYVDDLMDSVNVLSAEEAARLTEATDGE